jgi:hypothetical protein
MMGNVSASNFGAGTDMGGSVWGSFRVYHPVWLDGPQTLEAFEPFLSRLSETETKLLLSVAPSIVAAWDATDTKTFGDSFGCSQMPASAFELRLRQPLLVPIHCFVDLLLRNLRPLTNNKTVKASVCGPRKDSKTDGPDFYSDVCALVNMAASTDLYKSPGFGAQAQLLTDFWNSNALVPGALAFLADLTAKDRSSPRFCAIVQAANAVVQIVHLHNAPAHPLLLHPTTTATLATVAASPQSKPPSPSFFRVGSIGSTTLTASLLAAAPLISNATPNTPPNAKPNVKLTSNHSASVKTSTCNSVFTTTAAASSASSDSFNMAQACMKPTMQSTAAAVCARIQDAMRRLNERLAVFVPKS